jgi:alpha-beta hydrolase superfamily lysophospholipase
LPGTRFTVYSYGRRGRGDSGDARPYGTEREIDDLAAVIGAAGGKAHVWGLSSGAVLALEAVAVAMAGDIGEGPRIVDGLAATPALAGYHHLPSVRGDLLARLGRHGEAAGEFRRAASLTKNGPEGIMLLRRANDRDAQRS